MRDMPFKMQTTTDLEKWRKDTFWDKEPETIEWIESFGNSDTLWDIGANVGVYSLYHIALHPGGWAISFEPSVSNYTALCENCALNNFTHVVPVNAAIGVEAGVLHFKETNTEAGSSGGQLGIEGAEITVETIDRLVYGSSPIAVPDHIKIDIDGEELKVIQGGGKVLSRKLVKSVLVEIDKSGMNFEHIVSIMTGYGYSMDNRFNNMAVHSRIRREQEGINVENVIFTA